MDKTLHELALKAVDTILANLATSDFVTKCGAGAVDELKDYRKDMANDIVEAMFNVKNNG